MQMKYKYLCLPPLKNTSLFKSFKRFFSVLPLASRPPPRAEDVAGDSTSSGSQTIINETESPYLLRPNSGEIDRLQQQHYCYKHIFGSNISAPVEAMLIEGCKVLDVGCGAGIWLLEMATDYKKSNFLGVDMSAVFPIHIKPFNSSFIEANILNGLELPSNEFDYIHVSFMNSSFTNDQWQNIVIPELTRVLKPNGWLEFYDVDIIQINGGPLYDRFIETARQFLINGGSDPRAPTLYKQWLSSQTCLKDFSEIFLYPCIGTLMSNDKGIYNSGVGKRDEEGVDSINIKYDNTKTREERENNYDFLNENSEIFNDMEIGKLIRDVVKIFYALYPDELSKCMGVSKKKYLDLVEECFEREMNEYETRMKFMRVICRKDENS